MTSFKDRIIRAAKLDANLFEEVEAGKGAMGQAMAVVVLAGLKVSGRCHLDEFISKRGGRC